MRKLLVTTSILGMLSASSAFAGGVVEPIMPPEEVHQKTSSSSGGILIPLLLLVVVAAAIASSGGDDPVVSPSDARLKTGLRPVGVTHNGLSLYRYSYIGLDGEYEGVMAQDVVERFPEAVAQLPGGYMAVDYAKLGLTFKTIH